MIGTQEFSESHFEEWKAVPFQAPKTYNYLNYYNQFDMYACNAPQVMRIIPQQLNFHNNCRGFKHSLFHIHSCTILKSHKSGLCKIHQIKHMKQTHSIEIFKYFQNKKILEGKSWIFKIFLFIEMKISKWIK